MKLISFHEFSLLSFNGKLETSHLFHTHTLLHFTQASRESKLKHPYSIVGVSPTSSSLKQASMGLSLSSKKLEFASLSSLLLAMVFLMLCGPLPLVALA